MYKEKSCGAIVINEDKVLLIHQYNDVWGFPKGHMESGETEAETAIREVKEETNVDIEIDENKRYVIHYMVKENIPKEVVYFLAKPLGKTNIVKQASEVSDAYFENIDKVIDIISHENLKDMWKKVLEENHLY